MQIFLYLCGAIKYIKIMKKIGLIFASVALCTTLNAQHVTPLNINLPDFSLDSLRTVYAADAPMYRAELERIQNVQDANDKALSQARRELKDEKAHAKDVVAYLKERESAIASLQKAYDMEIQNKEVDLTQLENTLKVRKESVKAELKNVKANMK